MRLLLCLVALALAKEIIIQKEQSRANPTTPLLAATFESDISIVQSSGYSIRGTLHYDYPFSRQRIDMLSPRAILIENYAVGKRFTYFASAQTCTTDIIYGVIPDFRIPPTAMYLRDTVVRDMTVENWVYSSWDSKVSFFVQRTNGSSWDNLVRVRVEQTAQAVQYDFFNYTAIPQSGTLFDETQFGCEEQPPASTFTVEGYVTDASTGVPVYNALVYISNGTSTNMSAVGPGGAFIFYNVPEGEYVLTAYSTNYTTASRNISVHQNILPGTYADLSMSAVLASHEMRVVLTWGQYPDDLDLLLITPWFCTVSFIEKTCTGTWGDHATLDQDVSTGWGPETITIVSDRWTGYNFTVYVRGLAGAWNSSNATVTIYQGNNSYPLVTIPVQWAYDATDERGVYWHVAELNPYYGSYNWINQIVRKPPQNVALPGDKKKNASVKAVPAQAPAPAEPASPSSPRPLQGPGCPRRGPGCPLQGPGCPLQGPGCPRRGPGCPRRGLGCLS